MKKFLQVTGWILVVFACFYLMGLGERTPRGDLEERMDYLEERISELENRMIEMNNESYDDLHEEDQELWRAIDNAKEELRSEIEDLRETNGWVEDMISEISGRLEECEGIIDNEHPGERGFFGIHRGERYGLYLHRNAPDARIYQGEIRRRRL